MITATAPEISSLEYCVPNFARYIRNEQSRAVAVLVSRRDRARWRARRRVKFLGTDITARPTPRGRRKAYASAMPRDARRCVAIIGKSAHSPSPLPQACARTCDRGGNASLALEPPLHISQISKAQGRAREKGAKARVRAREVWASERGEQQHMREQQLP